MIRYHYKKLVIGKPSWQVIQDVLPTLAYEEGNARGFILSRDCTANRIKGRLVYTRICKDTKLNPATLEWDEKATDILDECKFELDFQKGLVRVEDRRGELNALFEHLDRIPDAHVEFEELNLNLLDLMLEMQGAYRKNQINRLGIRDYLAREDMLTNGNFKILNKQGGEKIAEKFSDQLDSFTLALKLPDGAVSVTVKRKGTVTASDDVPDELLLFVKDLLPRFHESEVETAEVVAP